MYLVGAWTQPHALAGIKFMTFPEKADNFIGAQAYNYLSLAASGFDDHHFGVEAARVTGFAKFQVLGADTADHVARVAVRVFRAV